MVGVQMFLCVAAVLLPRAHCYTARPDRWRRSSRRQLAEALMCS